MFFFIYDSAIITVLHYYYHPSLRQKRYLTIVFKSFCGGLNRREIIYMAVYKPPQIPTSQNVP